MPRSVWALSGLEQSAGLGCIDGYFRHAWRHAGQPTHRHAALIPISVTPAVCRQPGHYPDFRVKYGLPLNRPKRLNVLPDAGFERSRFGACLGNARCKNGNVNVDSRRVFSTHNQFDFENSPFRRGSKRALENHFAPLFSFSAEDLHGVNP